MIFRVRIFWSSLLVGGVFLGFLEGSYKLIFNGNKIRNDFKNSIVIDSKINPHDVEQYYNGVNVYLASGDKNVFGFFCLPEDLGDIGVLKVYSELLGQMVFERSEKYRFYHSDLVFYQGVDFFKDIDFDNNADRTKTIDGYLRYYTVFSEVFSVNESGYYNFLFDYSDFLTDRCRSSSVLLVPDLSGSYRIGSDMNIFQKISASIFYTSVLVILFIYLIFIGRNLISSIVSLFKRTK